MAGETKKSIIMHADKLTNQQSIMQADHTYIHAGIAFTISFDLGSISAEYHIALETPAAGTYLHYRPGSAKVTSDADSVHYRLREGITSYSGGVAYTPFNRNRNHSNASLVTVKTNVTPTVGSPILIDNEYLGSTGVLPARSGGGGGSGREIILKPSTIYLFSFNPGGATNVGFNNFWYEEEGT
jgi:hypothetical protein